MRKTTGIISTFCSALLLSALVFFSLGAISTSDKGTPLTLEKLPLDKAPLKQILSGETYVISQVDDTDIQNQKKQKLKLTASKLHPRNCRHALRTISQLENYSNFLEFISKSEYNSTTERLTLHLKHTLLPFDMVLDFNFKRPVSIGIYPFIFTSGFLSGLRGELHISEENNRCLFFVEANWQGSHTNIPKFVFETFTSVLTHMTLDRLFRISQ